MGATLKGKNLEQILFFKSNPQIRSDTVKTIKVQNKKDLFIDLSEGMENCKMSRKSQGILMWMISGYPEFNMCVFVFAQAYLNSIRCV